MRRRVTLLVVLGLLAAAPGPALATATSHRDWAEVMKQYGFGDDDVAQVRAGEIASHASAENEAYDNEITGFVALIIHAPLSRVVEYAREARDLRLSTTVLSEVRFPSDAPEGEVDAAFALVRFDESKDKADVKALASGNFGDRFNLSEPEIERLSRSAAGAPGEEAAALSTAYREVLRARYEAYRKRGLRGVAPYYRGERTSFPADEQFSNLQVIGVVGSAYPDFAVALRSYPEGSADFEEYFYVSREKLDKRPAFILGHEIGKAFEDQAFYVERQYYVGNTYNSQTAGAWALAIEDGTFVLHGTATYTDQVTGALTKLKRSVGRGKVTKELRAHYERLRKDIEAGN